LQDNFKTYEAIQHLVDLIQECNKYLTSEAKPKNLLIQKIAQYVTKILRVFGVVQGSDSIGFGDTGSGEGISKEETVAPFVDAFVDFREQIRNAAKSKSSPVEFLRHCDDVRDGTLANLGIRVEDSAETSVWKMDDPETIRKEVEEKRQKAAEAAAKKLKSKYEKLETDVVKAQQSRIPPSDWFKTGANAEKWGTFDADGKPLTTKAGEELNKSQQKSIAKELKNQEKAYEKLVKAAGDQGIDAYVAQLEEDLAALKLEIP
jgi:cysteinyl-tRNA synthetase